MPIAQFTETVNQLNKCVFPSERIQFSIIFEKNKIELSYHIGYHMVEWFRGHIYGEMD